MKLLKILALILCFAMVLSTMNVGVFANETATSDGLEEVIPAVATVNGEEYTDIQKAINAAQAGDTVIIKEGTYAVPSMKAGITVVGEGEVLLEGTLSGTLEDLTMKNLYIKGGNAQRWAYAKGDLVFENVTFEATSIYALHFDGISSDANLLYKNCTIIGWAAMGGSPESCVFDGCTIKDNGTYGVIRTYFDAEIKDCKFDVDGANQEDGYEDGIHAVGATVNVNNCTNANGDIKNIFNISNEAYIYVDDVLVLAPAKTYEVATKAELDEALANTRDGDTILLTADIDYGATQLKIEKAITLDLGGKKLTNSFGWGGLSLKNNPSIKNGTIDHQGGVAAIKAWNVDTLEDLTITVAERSGSTVGGIVIQEGNNVRIDSIKNVTINGEGLTNGIETYNCGNAEGNVIGSMENITIDATGTGMLISAPCGTATGCDIKGGTTGIELWIKGTYSATLDLVDCDVDGGKQALDIHDEYADNVVNNGTLKLTADADSTFTSENSKPLKLTIERAENVELSENILKLRTLDGAGTAEDPYRINNMNDLKWFRDDVNNGNTYNKKYVKLKKDIDLNSQEWTPIGNSTNKFEGTFDGSNNTISNLVITGNKSNVGLFGFTTGGEIKNLTVENANVSGRLNVGVVAGTPYTSKYNNIKVTGHIEINGMSYVGGVGGKNAYADWTDITVDVDETSYVNADSVENGTSYRTYVGGVIGFIGEGGHKFTNITSNIDVKGSVCDIGGITGIAHYGNVFENVSCSAEVVLTNENAPEDEKSEVGGIAGVWHNQKGQTVTFTNCSYTGTSNVPAIGAPYYASNNSVDTSGELIVDNKTVWPAVARIGDVVYKTLQKAFEEVKDGDTITVIADVKNTGDITIDNKNVVIDLNGHTVNGAISPSTGNITIENGSIVNTDSTISAIEINRGKLNLTNVNIESARHAVRIDGEVEAVIDGGTYKVGGSAGKTQHAVNISGKANVTIKNGTFIGPKGTVTDSGSAVNVQEGATVTIEGGTFTGGKNNTLAAKGTLVISGGTFDQNPETYVTEDASVIKNTLTGLWSVIGTHTIDIEATPSECYGEETVTVTVKVNGADFANAEWKLTYDKNVVEYASYEDNTNGEDKTEPNVSDGVIQDKLYTQTKGDPFKGNTVLVTYTFKTISQNADDVKAEFVLSDAVVDTWYSANFGDTKVDGDSAEVMVKHRDFENITISETVNGQTSNITSKIVDGVYEIPYDGFTHEFTVDTSADDEVINYAITKDGSSVTEILAKGTYEIEYTIEKTGYKPVTRSFKVVIGDPDFVLETSTYTLENYTLVMVYMTADGMAPTFGGKQMYDITASGYKYQANPTDEGKAYPFVYGIVIPEPDASENLTLKVAFNTVDAITINPYDEDVNFSGEVTDRDAVVTINTYQGYKDQLEDYNLLSRVLKADVNKDKIVNTEDVTLVETAAVK